MAKLPSKDSTELILSRRDCAVLNCICLKLSTHMVAWPLELRSMELWSKYPNYRIGSHTFFPKQKKYYEPSRATELKESPFLGAAKSGNIPALEYFLSTFGPIIDINASGTCTFLETSVIVQSQVLHKCTTLFAACGGNQNSLEVVKLLVSHGASVNVTNCGRSTPLMHECSCSW